MNKLKTSLAGILSLLICAVAFSAPPPPPQNIQQAWLGSESLLLWDEAPGATSYNIYRADDTNTTWTLVGSSAVPRFRDSTYEFLPSFYVITAVNEDGEGSVSEISTVSFVLFYAISVSEPQWWTGTLSPTNAIIQWTTSDFNGGQGLLDWGLDATNYTYFAINTNYLLTQTFEFTNLSPLTLYHYRITSITSNRAGTVYFGSFGTPDTNHPPVAEDYTSFWPSFTNGMWIPLRGHDSNLPPATLTYRIVSQPTNGILSEIQPGWMWNPAYVIYTPAAGARGPDYFQYVVNNGTWDSAPALVTLTNWSNRLPAVTNGSLTLVEDTPTPFSIPATDPDGDPVQFTFYSMNGTISGTAPDLVYTPETNFNGFTTVWYQMNDGFDSAQGYFMVNVTPVNDPPQIMTNWMQSLTFTTMEDSPVSIWLFINDPDPIGPLEIVALAQPAHGTLSGEPWNYTYTPNPNFFGTDQFTIAPREIDGATGNPVTFTVQVQSGLDAPVAFDQDLTVLQATPRVIVPTGFDVDGGPLNFHLAGNASHGWVQVTETNWTYSPLTNFVGDDAFTFYATDADGIFSWYSATVRLHVVPNDASNHAPDAADSSFALRSGGTFLGTLVVSDADGDALSTELGAFPTNGAVSLNGTNFTYTANANAAFTGDSFTFRASDGQTNSRTAAVWVRIGNTNTAPTARDQLVTTIETRPLSIVLDASDVDAEPLQVVESTQPAHGAVEFFGYPAPTALYIAAPGFLGSDTFSYRVSDGTATGNLATVTIQVVANTPPVATDHTWSLPEEWTIDFQLDGSDADGDGLTFVVLTPPAHGSLWVIPTAYPWFSPPGHCQYNGHINYVGTDSFTYAWNDGLALSAPATVTFNVTPINDRPTATNQSITTAEDVPAAIALTGADVDGDALAFSLVTSPQHGALSGTPPNITYTPATDYFGSDTFKFRVSDGTLSATGTVNIAVTAVNDLPTPDGLHRRIYFNDGIVRLWWNAVPGAPSYRVYRALTNGGPFTLLASNITTTNYNDATAVWQQTYWYRVVTWDGAAEGAPSNPVLARRDDTGLITLNEPYWLILGTTARVQFCSSLILGTEGLWEYGTTTNYDRILENTNILGCQNFNLAPLTPQTIYYYRLTATDSNGNAIAYASSFATKPPPVANAQSESTWEDTELFVALSGNSEYFPAGYGLTYSIVSSPAHGTLTSTGPNTFRYLPATNYNGADSFTFKVNNGELDSAPATVSLTVYAWNDAPVSTNSSIAIPEDATWPIALNGVDVEGSALTFDVVTPPAHGVIVGNDSSGVVYRPETNYFGTDSFSYQAFDGSGFGNVATVSIVITNIEDLPVANSQSVTTPEDVNQAITLTGVDGDGDPLAFSIDTPPTQGVLTGTPPNVTYRPPTNFNGTAQFTFRAHDGKNYSAPATVTLTVTPVNDPPIASNISVTVTEDVTALVPAAFMDVENDVPSVELVSLPAHGTAWVNGLNMFYQPATNYTGPDSFTYHVTDGFAYGNTATVSISVTPVNDAPVANVQSITLNEDVSAAVTLTAADVDSGSLTYTVLAAPTNGTLSGNAPDLTYTPNADFHGGDSFGFSVSDGSLSSTSLVTLTVLPVNDAPVADAPGAVNVEEDSSVAVVLAGSDVDGDALTFSIVTPPAHGTLSGTLPNLTYTPDADYNGNDAFSFRASDGQTNGNTVTVSITVLPLNDAPVADAQSVATSEDQSLAITLGATDVDGDALSYTVVAGPAHGTLGGTAPNLTYTPAANYNGPDSFGFQVTDGSLSNAATVTIDVAAVNDAPVANAQSVALAEDTSLPITLSGSDVEGSALTFNIATAPAHGTLSGAAPNLTYTPAANYSGADSFTFTANDGTANSSAATVSITVTPVNDAPVANPQSVAVAEDFPLAITLTGSDIEGSALSYTVLTAPAHGTLTGAAPNLTYQPAANYNGADSFTFRVNDGLLDSGTAAVSINVTAVNDAPVANAQSVTVIYNSAKAMTLTGSDLEGGALTYSIVTAPTNGTLSGTAPNVTYTPAVGSAGADWFTFQANDGTSNSAAATVSITTLNPSGIPPAPSSLHVTVPTATGTLILDWNCGATNEDGFKIERSLNSSSGWSQIATTGINIHTFTNTGLTSGTRYYYRVRSYNRLGNSAYSNTVNQKPR